MKQDGENLGSDLGQARINSKQQADQNRYISKVHVILSLDTTNNSIIIKNKQNMEQKAWKIRRKLATFSMNRFRYI